MRAFCMSVAAFLGLTIEQFDVLIVLVGFGLCAFAIYAVLQGTRERS